MGVTFTIESEGEGRKVSMVVSRESGPAGAAARAAASEWNRLHRELREDDAVDELAEAKKILAVIDDYRSGEDDERSGVDVLRDLASERDEAVTEANLRLRSLVKRIAEAMKRELSGYSLQRLSKIVQEIAGDLPAAYPPHTDSDRIAYLPATDEWECLTCGARTAAQTIDATRKPVELLEAFEKAHLHLPEEEVTAPAGDTFTPRADAPATTEGD